MLNLFTKKIFIFIIFFLVIFLLPEFIFASVSPDAIAVRVMPNSDHLSPLSWYQANIKNQGSPQTLTVDGYEAVRDGRTVYVNAANISGTDFYTNIYIISYNQSAESATTDIFGQILFHWKFNTNIPQMDSPNCHKITATGCIHDPDCQAGDYCQSNKAILNRDTKRLADLQDIKSALGNYEAKNGFFPKLESGSYLANKTISTWPSWQSTLGSELNITTPKDPINQLGDCPENYDKITCWDQKIRKFYDPTPADNEFTLPNNSYGYVYTVKPDGVKYNLCSYTESGFIKKGDSGACQDSYSTIIGETEKNQIPEFTGLNLKTAYSGKSYDGYIEAIEPFGNPLTWSITPKSGCDMWEGLTLQPALVSTQRQVAAVKAGVGGTCTITVTIDNRKPGGKVMKDFDIIVINNPPVINFNNCASSVRINNQYSCAIIATDPDGHGISSYAFTNLPGGVMGAGSGANGTISGKPNYAGVYNIKVTVTDQFGAEGSKEYTLQVKTYCGDGVRQAANDEGGAEECDDGFANSDINNNSGFPVSSCTTGCKWSRFTNFSTPTITSVVYDSIALDDDNITTHAEEHSSTYLKLLGVQPTPYAYFADIGLNQIIKMRVTKFDGGYPRVCKVSGTGVSLCYWDMNAAPESFGKVKKINVSSIVPNPSRTAVNVETGDFWVHSRTNQAVARFDYDGNLKMGPCKIDPGVSTVVNGGGLAIDEDGNAWAGSYETGTIKLFKGDTSICTVLKTISSPALISGVYGLAINADGDLFVRGKNGELAKIKVSDGSNTITRFTNAAGAGSYGVTVDLNGNPWWGATPLGVQTVNKDAPNGTVTTAYGDTDCYAISIDVNGAIWCSSAGTGGIHKYDTAGNLLLNLSGTYTTNHGISGTSEGTIFSPYYVTGDIIYYYDNGSNASYATGDITTAADVSGFIYTYADMAGLNRAMQFRSGNLTKTIDAGHADQHWGNLSYDLVMPAKTSVEVYIAAAENKLDLPSFLMDKDSWNALSYTSSQHKGRYLMIRILLRSRQKGITPVISNIKLYE